MGRLLRLLSYTTVIWALLAAALFGAGVPVSKKLLGPWDEFPLAATLYLASGAGLFAARPFAKSGRPLGRPHLKWLAGAVLLGGMVAPVALLYGLRATTGYAGALLLNVEAVFTATIAVALFRERLRGAEWGAIAVLLLGATAVAWATAQEKAATHPLLGAMLVLVACLCWGFDNNFTRRIAECDPLQIAGVKGLVAGSVNLAIGLSLGQRPPLAPAPLAAAAALGLAAYGLSLVFFVLALRRLGSARTGAIFSTGQLVAGVAVSWLVLGERPAWPALAGGAVIVAGILWMATAAAPTDGTRPGERASLPG
jgi:drug/metabolite transporter (DMT)-like permease